MKTFIFYIIWPLIFICAASCEKFVDIAPPEDQIISSQVFTSNTKAESTVTAIYGNMINGAQTFSNFLITLYGGMSSDELNRFNPSNLFLEFLTNELMASNAQIRNIWSTAYKTIFFTNTVLEGLSGSNAVDGAKKSQLSGECKFIRAYCYFYLVNLFGDVPLALTSDYAQNASLQRAPVSQVYEQMIMDLQEAKANLSKVYFNNEKSRPNYWAATALLARIHLYRKEWAKAEAEASEIIDQGPFTPLLSPEGVFLKNSKEAIWQLAPTNGSMQETRQMRPSGNAPQVYIPTGLMNAFEMGDSRRKRWVDSIVYQNQKYYFPGKYKNTSSVVTEYYMMLRAAEQFLIRSEARAQQNKLPDAIMDLNTLRARAGLSLLPASLAQSAVITAVETERRTELFAEWAHRWFDLKRTGQAMSVLGALKTTWQPTDTLYPIPQEDILLNAQLTQNKGY